MHFVPNEVYHIYNRGNNRQKVFFSEENYLFFMRKMEAQLIPFCEILVWCLMPNHFHLIISTNESSCKPRNSFGTGSVQELSYRIGIMLSSYAQAVNKQHGTSGSLFQLKTKAKILTGSKNAKDKDYLVNAMHYCHQNPLRAGLVKKIEDWPYSSFPGYCRIKEDDITNKQLLLDLTGYSLDTFYSDSYGRMEGFELEE
ncbi:MAG: transposase [Chitinophagaceae bacterium]|nr:transposase [Chitinophagaceae bacterium]